jgi:hypothetical protein
MNIAPAGNITSGGIAGTAAMVIIHLLRGNGIQVDDDAADGIVFLATILTAHLVDMYTGGNKPVAVPPPTLVKTGD